MKNKLKKDEVPRDKKIARKRAHREIEQGDPGVLRQARHLFHQLGEHLGEIYYWSK